MSRCCGPSLQKLKFHPGYEVTESYSALQMRREHLERNIEMGPHTYVHFNVCVGLFQ